MSATLTRATLGRLAAYAQSPVSGVEDIFVATDFETPPNCALGVTSGFFYIQALSSNIYQRVAKHIATGDRADVFIVVVTDPTSGASQQGAGARSDGVAYPNNSAILGDVPLNGAFATRVIEVVAGSQLQGDSDAANLSGAQRVSLWVKGTSAKTYAFGPGFQNALTGLTLSAAGGVGPTYNRGSAGTVEYSAIQIMSDAIFTVNGPAGTWRADIVDGSGVVLASAASVAGVASIDLFAARTIFPNAVKVEIRDTGTDALLVDATPAERLWGGDVWTYAESVAVPTVPGAPSSANVTDTTADISWTGVGAATSYKLFRATNPAGPFTEIVEQAGTSYPDSGLTPSTTYYYQVAACNSGGCSVNSSSHSFTTLAGAGPDAPATPTLVEANPSSIEISWGAVVDADYYQVQRAVDAAGPWTTVADLLVALSFEDTGLTSETTYFHRVLACDVFACNASGALETATTSWPAPPERAPRTGGQPRLWRRRRPLS